MKLILFFAVSCLAFQNGTGAPRNAVYKFVKCNPEGDQANCVTQQSASMAWSPELPEKLPASTARYLEAEPEEEDESEEEVSFEMDEPNESEEGESPVETVDGSGGSEGSADGLAADWGFGETGSGESWAEKGEQYRDGDLTGMRRLFPSKSVVAEARPAEHELREDHLLQL